MVQVGREEDRRCRVSETACRWALTQRPPTSNSRGKCWTEAGRMWTRPLKSYYYYDERGTAIRTTDNLSTPPGERFPFPPIERLLPLKNEAKKRSQDPTLGRPASATNGWRSSFYVMVGACGFVPSQYFTQNGRATNTFRNTSEVRESLCLASPCFETISTQFV